MKRLFDLVMFLICALLFSVPIFLIGILVKLTSDGPIIYYSERVGKDNHFFQMPKFRTMQTGTPTLATHLLSNPDSFLTPVGRFLRKSSLDELPQLLSILKGDMSFVGPRPALYNQDDLIELRTQKGVHVLTPGLTGWAQINGRDDLSIPAKVDYDLYYLQNYSFGLDLKVIFLTIAKILRSEGVTH